MISVLLVEDSPTQALAIRAALAQADPPFAVEHVLTLGDAVERLSSDGIDVVLLDLTLPDAQGMDTFSGVYGKAPEVPIVVLTSVDDMELAMSALGLGAQDYLIKSQADADRIARSIRYALERARMVQARSQFFAAISHEFRTPLFAIIGHAEMLLDPDFAPDDDAWRAEFGDTIKGSAEHLLSMVNEIMDLAKLVSGAMEVDLEPVPLGEVADDVARALAPMAHGAALTLDVQMAPMRPVAADRARLRQILLNLLSNAIKYTPSGGRVEMRGREEDGRARVDVIDTGVGIPADAAAHIFEPFYQVPGTSAQKGQPSTGLGLALVKRLVEAQDGTVRMQSVPGVGTTFTVEFPFAELV